MMYSVLNKLLRSVGDMFNVEDLDLSEINPSYIHEQLGDLDLESRLPEWSQVLSYALVSAKNTGNFYLVFILSILVDFSDCFLRHPFIELL